jgi:hypothetical protein
MIKLLLFLLTVYCQAAADITNSTDTAITEPTETFYPASDELAIGLTFFGMFATALGSVTPVIVDKFQSTGVMSDGFDDRFMAGSFSFASG